MVITEYKGEIMTNKATIKAKTKPLLESRQDYTDYFSIKQNERYKGGYITELIFGDSRYYVSMVGLYEAVSNAVDKDDPAKVIYITDKPRTWVTDYVVRTVEGGDFKYEHSLNHESVCNPKSIQLFNDNLIFLTCGIPLEDPDFPDVINNLLAQVKGDDKRSAFVVIDNIDFNTESEFLDKKSIIKLYNNVDRIDANVTLLHKGTNGIPEGGSIHTDCSDVAIEVIKENNERLRRFSIKGLEDNDEYYRLKGDSMPLHWTYDDTYNTQDSEPKEKKENGIIRNPETGLYELYHVEWGEVIHIGTYYSMEKAIDAKRSRGWLK